MEKVFFYKTTIGSIGIIEKDNFITNLLVNENIPNHHSYTIDESILIKKTFSQLEEYLLGKRKYFSVPINPWGTDFQKQVWTSLLKIKYGSTLSYKELGCMINKPKSYQAVGNALGKNPLPIIIPCHRVIGSDGSLGGFKLGLPIKKHLINLESRYMCENIK